MSETRSRPGSEFDDDDVVRCYAGRAPYPAALFQRLRSLATGPGRLLDLGCGTGKLTLGLADAFEAIDAIDPSAAMLSAARAADGGRSNNIRWIEAYAEDAPLAGLYDLAVAGAAIHWMRHETVMPRLAQALAPGAPLVVAEGGRSWNDRQHRQSVTAHLPWMEVNGAETFAHTVSQPVATLIEAQHSRATWARAKMGPADAAAFGADLREVLEPAATNGEVAFVVQTRASWGCPRKSPKTQ